MTREKQNVALLSACQALFQSILIINLIASGFVGLKLAGDKSLATLPIAMLIVSTTVLMIPASFFMQRFGRRVGFSIGSGGGIAGGLLAMLAIYQASFTLFLLANMLLGVYQAFAQYYRFAAADIASPAFKSRAISWVVAGGIVAALAGPALTRLTQNLGSPLFIATYATISALALASLLLLGRIELPKVAIASVDDRAERPLHRIVRQPIFVAALAGSAAGFGIMSMVMTATPLAMGLCGLGFGASASVIQWHVLGMFVPSFFTGHLLKRFGTLSVMSAGLLLFAAHIAIARSGIGFYHFAVGLVLLGVGWNFLFVGGTSLLTESYTAGEKAKTQAAHDFFVFGLVSLTSFGAGSLLQRFGWDIVNLTAVPMMLLAAAALLWLALHRRTNAFAFAAAKG